VFLLEGFAFEPERVQALLFTALKWIAATFCVFATVTVWQFHAAADAYPPAGDTADEEASDAWGRYGILRMFAL
jgi:hypothetical protein